MNPRDLPVRISQLKHMAQSPAHYHYAVTHEFPDRDALQLGRAVHSMVLGGPRVVYYESRRAGKAWEAFEANHVGCEILTAKDYVRAEAIADRVLSHPVMHAFLSSSDKERTISWNIGRRACRSTLDIVDDGIVVDLKTCRTARPDWFQRAAVSMGYHAQMAFYQAAAAFCGYRQKDAFIVAVESKPPFDVVVHQLTPRALDQGKRTYHAWFERLLVCEETNEWPGYAQGIVDFDMPDEVDLNLDGIEDDETEEAAP